MVREFGSSFCRGAGREQAIMAPANQESVLAGDPQNLRRLSEGVGQPVVSPQAVTRISLSALSIAQTEGGTIFLRREANRDRRVRCERRGRQRG
jgi:hypothetical protein